MRRNIQLLDIVTSPFKPLLENHVYVAKSGLVKGLKRIGGFGFIPRKGLTLEHEFLKNLDLAGKTIYDVGAYNGFTTIFFARAVGGNGRVVAFEPNPQNYGRIFDHITLNGFENVRVVRMGLSDKRETLELVVPADPAQGSADPQMQSALSKKKITEVLQVEMDTLDNQIKVHKLPKPDFIKIDVEGMEIRVIQGMSETIEKYRPQLHIELHGACEKELLEILLACNYSIYLIEKDIEIARQNIREVFGGNHIYAY